MKYEKNNLYYDTSDIIIIARAAVRGRSLCLLRGRHRPLIRRRIHSCVQIELHTYEVLLLPKCRRAILARQGCP